MTVEEWSFDPTVLPCPRARASLWSPVSIAAGSGPSPSKKSSGQRRRPGMGLMALLVDDLHADPGFRRKLRKAGRASAISQVADAETGSRYRRRRISAQPVPHCSPNSEQQVSLVASDGNGAAGLFELSAAELRPDCIVHDLQITRCVNAGRGPGGFCRCHPLPHSSFHRSGMELALIYRLMNMVRIIFIC